MKIKEIVQRILRRKQKYIFFLILIGCLAQIKNLSGNTKLFHNLGEDGL